MENLSIARRVVLGSNMDGGKRISHSIASIGTSEIPQNPHRILAFITHIPHQIAARLKSRMEMPDSPPSQISTTAAKSTWETLHSSLPVSYRVAIAVDAFVLFITFTAFLLLTFYIRKQIRRRRIINTVDELEMKYKNGIRSDSVSTQSTDLESNAGEKKIRGLLRKFTRKKRHVRWTSTVEKCGFGDVLGERERVRMKRGSEEWETDTWGPRSEKNELCNNEEKGFDIGMRGGGGNGFRVNPLGKSKKGGVGSIGGDGEWKRGSLWKGIEEERQKARETRSRDRIAAGYDGYRGN